jgi:hypothetical protein
MLSEKLPHFKKLDKHALLWKSQFLRVLCSNRIGNCIGIRICIFDYQTIFCEILGPAPRRSTVILSFFCESSATAIREDFPSLFIPRTTVSGSLRLVFSSSSSFSRSKEILGPGLDCEVKVIASQLRYTLVNMRILRKTE